MTAAMKIKLNVSRATATNEAWRPGDVLTVGVEIDEAEAKRLLEQGSAEPVAQTKQARAEQRG